VTLASAFKPFVLEIPQQPGTCRYCEATEPPNGWANYEQTLCTACEQFNGLIRTRSGRQELLRLLKARAQ
jgi:hypothetical protein